MNLQKATPIQFKPSVEERLLLEKYCEQEARTMSDVLRQLIRELKIKGEGNRDKGAGSRG